MKANRFVLLCTVLLAALLLTSCISEKENNIPSDSSLVMEEPACDRDIFLDADIVVPDDMENGKLQELAPSTELQGESDPQIFIETLFRDHGIKISPRQISNIAKRFNNVDYLLAGSIKFVHYYPFDILYVEHKAYRDVPNGTVFVFEDGVYKGCVEQEGRIESPEIFKEVDDRIWLVTYQYYSGTELSGEYVNWTDLDSIDLNVITVYHNYELRGTPPYHLQHFYEENFVTFVLLDSGTLAAVINYTQRISDPEKIIVFERSGERTTPISRYTNVFPPDVTLSILEENLTSLEDYVANGTTEEQQAAKEILDLYYEENKQ